MYFFVEMWRPKEKWLEMSPSDRAEYIESIGPSIQGLLEEGVELVGIGRNEEDVDQQADYEYWAVWKLPDEELLDAFQAAVREDGFYDYFEQINACGEPGGPKEVLGGMAEL